MSVEETVSIISFRAHTIFACYLVLFQGLELRALYQGSSVPI